MDTAAPMDGWWQQRELFDAARGRPSRCRRKRTKHRDDFIRQPWRSERPIYGLAFIPCPNNFPRHFRQRELRRDVASLDASRWRVQVMVHSGSRVDDLPSLPHASLVSTHETWHAVLSTLSCALFDLFVLWTCSSCFLAPMPSHGVIVRFPTSPPLWFLL